jgi:hypothetical protein
MLARVLAARGAVPMALALMACRTPAEESLPRTPPGTASATTTEVASGGPDSIEHDARHAAIETATSSSSPVSATPYTPPASLVEPTAIYRASLPRPVFVERDTASALRGRIEMRESFRVYALHEGEDDDGCSKPWVQVGEAAWVCSKHTEVDDDAEPHVLPRLANQQLLPFVYARHVRHDDPTTPKLPVYRHLAGLRSGADPIDWLAAFGTYAFVRRARSGGAPVLIDGRGRVVPGADMRLFKPTEFHGRDLVAAPVPDDRVLAWVIHRDTGVHTQADPESELQPIAYHAALLVSVVDTDTRVVGSDRASWIRVPATRPGELGEPAITSEGWIPAAHVRLWRPLPPPEPILAGQRLIDVDLDQQTLTVWLEDQPTFATLIASGKPGYSTPLGLYRIITKRAYGKMASLPTEPDPYWVDAVPWTMYFDGRFALHGAFWHDRFGYRVSHGCINLSPIDAKIVFDQITPTLPAGWLIVNEHASDPGSLVRVHKGSVDVPDQRRAKLEGALLDD